LSLTPALLTITANSNVRRALDSFAMSSRSQSSPTRQGSTHPEHGDRPASNRNGEQGSVGTVDLTTSIEEEVIHLGNEADQHTSDFRAGGFESVKYQPKIYSFIQSSELPALNNQEPSGSLEATQPELKIEPTEDLKGQADDHWHEPVS